MISTPPHFRPPLVSLLLPTFPPESPAVHKRSAHGSLTAFPSAGSMELSAHSLAPHLGGAGEEVPEYPGGLDAVIHRAFALELTTHDAQIVPRLGQDDADQPPALGGKVQRLQQCGAAMHRLHGSLSSPT